MNCVCFVHSTLMPCLVTSTHVKSPVVCSVTQVHMSHILRQPFLPLLIPLAGHWLVVFCFKKQDFTMWLAWNLLCLLSAGCKGVHHHTLPKPFTYELSSGRLYGAFHTRVVGCSSLSANVLWHFDFLQPSVHNLVHSQWIFLKLFLNCHYFFHGFKYFITLNLLVCVWKGRGTRHTIAQLYLLESVLPPCGSWGCQAWQQMHLPQSQLTSPLITLEVQKLFKTVRLCAEFPNA